MHDGDAHQWDAVCHQVVPPSGNGDIVSTLRTIGMSATTGQAIQRTLCRSQLGWQIASCAAADRTGARTRSIVTSTLQTRSSLAKFQKNLQCSRNFAKVSAISLTSKKRHGHKISMVTAYDYPSAIHVARAEIDVILVGDSLAMVELGHETTQPITVDDMIHHCSAVKRGVEYANVKNPPLLVGDMPFGSYEFENTDIALQNAYRFVKEAGMDAIKVEVSGVACM